jgi:hypothetical protein
MVPVFGTGCMWVMKRIVWFVVLLQCLCRLDFSQAISKQIIQSLNQRLRWPLQMHPRALCVDAA